MKNIKHNRQTHDKIFKVYNLKHKEIYNSIEQKRVKKIVSNLVNNKRDIKVLDVGAGTGNLSLKFLEFGCQVNALDVSNKSLKLLKNLSNNNPKLNLVTIEGKKFPFKDNEFDIVCTYSVLHHIPDYLYTVKEMIRVSKPGGLIYIDHEANKNKYFPDKHLKEYKTATKQTFMEHLSKLFKTGELFTPDFLKGVFIKLFINKRYQREGDIHVYKDDHIEWDKIKDLFLKNNCKIIEEVDYLLFQPKGGFNLWNEYKKKTNDTKYIVAKKCKNRSGICFKGENFE